MGRTRCTPAASSFPPGDNSIPTHKTGARDLVKDNQSLSEKVASLETSLEQQSQIAAHAAKDRDALLGAEAALQGVVDEISGRLNSKVMELEGRLKGAEARLEGKTREGAVAEGRLADALAGLGLAEEQVMDLRRELVDVKGRKGELEEALKAAKEALRLAEAGLKSAEEERDGAMGCMARAEEERDGAREAADAARGEMLSRFRRLEEACGDEKRGMEEEVGEPNVSHLGGGQYLAS